MTSTIRRCAVVAAAAALCLSVAPASQAAPVVCNQASPHWLGGGLVALDPPVDSPAARYTVDIGKLPAEGAGVFTAAVNSPSLTVCDLDDGDVIIYPTGVDTSVDVGDGIVDIAT